MKVVINPAYKILTPFLEKLSETFDQEGYTIYKARNEIKRFTWQGVEFTVKSYKVPIFVNRIAYTFFRPSKARRAYTYAQYLLEHGIRTPSPVAYIETKKGGLFYRGFFVSEMEKYPRLMREFTHGIIPQGEKILRDFAQFTFDQHDAGIFHLDYSPGNILFEERDGGYQFSLVDLNRMFLGSCSNRQCLKNFERISFSPEVVACVVSEYARIRGWNIEDSVKIACRYQSEFMRKWEKKMKIKNKLRECKKR